MALRFQEIFVVVVFAFGIPRSVGSEPNPSTDSPTAPSQRAGQGSENLNPQLSDYVLRLRGNQWCINDPIELEWTAPASHNTQVSHRSGSVLKLQSVFN